MGKERKGWLTTLVTSRGGNKLRLEDDGRSDTCIELHLLHIEI